MGLSAGWGRHNITVAAVMDFAGAAPPTDPQASARYRFMNLCRFTR